MIGDELAALLDALPEPVLVWGPDRRLRRVNGQAAGLGLAPGRALEEVAASLGTDPARLLPPGVWAGEVAPLELRLERRVLVGKTVPVRAATGEVLLAVTLLEDVTDQRRSDELRAGEARVLELVAAEEPLLRVLVELASIFEAHAEGMLASVLLIEDGRVRHVAAPSLPAAWSSAVDGEPIGPDRGSCGTAAYLREPVIVTDIAVDPRWALYREPALAFGLRACWSIPLLGAEGDVLGTFAFYYQAPRAPTQRLLELATRAGRLATVAIQHDRHRERLLRLREREQLDAILAAAPSAVAIWKGATVRYANHRATATFGLRAGDDERLRYVDPEVERRVSADLAAGILVSDMELQARAATGEALDLLATFRPIEYQGEPCVLGYLVDVTALKRTKDAAEAAARAKSAFLATMSHEIRTPMNAVLGYAQLLQGDGSLGAAQREKVGVIRASGEHLLGLLDNVLEMSRLEAGRTPLEFAPFDLHRLLFDLEALFAPLAAARGLELAFERAEGLPRELIGDAGKVRQVLLNLLSNALKFTERGRILVQVAGRDEGPRARVTVRVEDTGAGIEPEVLPRIFDAFVKTPLGERAGGSGLGLTLSRSFARLMGGSLEVQSAVGQGSAFTLELVAGREGREADLPPGPGGGPAPAERTRGGTSRLAAAAELAALLAELPDALRGELRQAALRARPGRVLEVAERVAALSPRAALRIQALAEELRYDRLLAALEGSSS